MECPGEVAASQRVLASFRDPAGYVFRRGHGIFRAISDACHEVLRALSESGALSKLIEDRRLVGTRWVGDPLLLEALKAEHPGYQHFLEHDVIPDITYPYEWSVSMLADAALHTLDLQAQLLQAGCSLKDGTAYNIQFTDGRPVFIDISSIERPARLDLWFALGQFEQFFFYPLVLCCRHGWDLRSYFLASLNGRTVEEVARAVGWMELLRPRSLLDITLPFILNRALNRKGKVNRSRLQKTSSNSQPQIVNLRRLRKKIEKLAANYRPKGVWSDYASTCSYNNDAESEKRALVKAFLERARPATVLDMGCNTGDYSYLAAAAGAHVIAVDGDHDSIELLYRRLRKAPASISPMVVDLTNPSPAIGFLNSERDSFLDRVQVDCVLALALVHHLLVAGNLSLAAIRELFCRLTKDFLVLEFVPSQDSQFQRLIKFRRDLFASFTLQACKDVFLERFNLIKEEPIPDSERTLLLFQKST
jgi:SAM-dependent methyltransferase